MQIFLSQKSIIRQNLKVYSVLADYILCLKIESKILFLQTHGKTHRKKKNHPKNPQKSQETLALAQGNSVVDFGVGFRWSAFLG